VPDFEVLTEDHKQATIRIRKYSGGLLFFLKKQNHSEKVNILKKVSESYQGLVK
jgi:hypothetical protein